MFVVVYSNMINGKICCFLRQKSKINWIKILSCILMQKYQNTTHIDTIFFAINCFDWWLFLWLSSSGISGLNMGSSYRSIKKKKCDISIFLCYSIYCRGTNCISLLCFLIFYYHTSFMFKHTLYRKKVCITVRSLYFCRAVSSNKIDIIN